MDKTECLYRLDEKRNRYVVAVYDAEADTPESYIPDTDEWTKAGYPDCFADILAAGKPFHGIDIIHLVNGIKFTLKCDEFEMDDMSESFVSIGVDMRKIGEADRSEMFSRVGTIMRHNIKYNYELRPIIQDIPEDEIAEKFSFTVEPIPAPAGMWLVWNNKTNSSIGDGFPYVLKS